MSFMYLKKMIVESQFLYLRTKTPWKVFADFDLEKILCGKLCV